MPVASLPRKAGGTSASHRDILSEGRIVSTDIDTDVSTFPRSARLRTPHQFQATFANGRRLHAALFRLHAHISAGVAGVSVATDASPATPLDDPATARSTSLALARLGISVSKRVAAHAVERNRIRRIARDSFRRIRLQLPAGDYVLLAQREAKGASSESLREALAGLWRRAVALKPAACAPTMPIPASPSAVDDPPPIPER
jgi:ribonuclease P protein component